MNGFLNSPLNIQKIYGALLSSENPFLYKIDADVPLDVAFYRRDQNRLSLYVDPQ